MEPKFFSSFKNSKGRALILANEIYPQICVGGLGKFVAGISRGLVKDRWEVAVFTPEKDGPVYLPYFSSECQARSKKFAQEVLRWCQTNTWLPSWVWVQDWEGVYQAEIWQRKAKIIWTIHSPIGLNASSNYESSYGYSEPHGEGEPIDWGDDFFDFCGLVEQGISSADLITTVSPNFANELKHSFAFAKAEKILGISNGVDIKNWDPCLDNLLKFKLKNNWREFKETNKKILQRHFGLPQKEAPVFVFVSRLVPQKGIDLLIKILPEFLAKNKVQFIIVGKGIKRYHDFFKTLQRNFSSQVALCLQSNFSLPHQVFAGADFLLLPSLAEPFGIVVAESRRYGVIPVVRGVGGLADQVKDGINGLSFQENKAGVLLDKLYQGLGLWRTYWWWKMSSSGKNLVEDWNKVARKYGQVLLASN